MHQHSQEQQRSHSKRCLGNHRCLQHLFASPSSSHAPASLHITHGELSSEAPAPCGASVGSKLSCRDPVRCISFQGFSSVRASSTTVPNTHIPIACLLIPILMEALTQGNLRGGANDEHVWDGPQQGVMDCPLGPAQLIQPLPSPCQPG